MLVERVSCAVHALWVYVVAVLGPCLGSRKAVIDGPLARAFACRHGGKGA